MTDTPPEPHTPVVAKHVLADIFSQANITTGLAVFAVVLAAATYVLPPVQSFMVERGLMNRPSILMDASRKLQTETTEKAAKDATLAIKAHYDSIFNDANDPVLGKGPIKVVEFMDYQCAYCRAATPALKDFLAENPDVQLVIKEYPVVHPPFSVTLGAYGMAAFQGGHYEPVHYAFLTQTIGSEAEMDNLLTQAGLDATKAKAVAESSAVTDHIKKTIKLGDDLGITGTPTFIVGDQMINGADITRLQNAVAALRVKK